MKTVHYANALIVDETNERVLLVKNGRGEAAYWSFPGGGVEPGESLRQAVIREVNEETGLVIEPRGLYSVREVYFKRRKEHALIFTFTAERIGGKLSIGDPDDEITEARWFDIQTANDLMPYIPAHLRIAPERKTGFAFYHFHGEADV